MKYAFLLFLLLIPLGYAAITCSIETSTTCSTGTKILGLENETGGGLTNAHAQNNSLDTYANSLCCTTNISDTLTNSCTETTFAKLSANDNAHVQDPDVNTYSVDACIGYASTGVECNAVNRSCLSNESCLMSMSDFDNAHAGACDEYDVNICCFELQGPPTVPVLLTPADNNLSVFERYTEFTWEASTDPQSDPITYEVNITAPAGCSALPTYNVTSTNYTSSEELCVDQNYTWTARACDNTDRCSAYATEHTFQIASVIGVTFTTNNTDFGALAASIPGQNETDNTIDNSPTPLVLENTGNVRINTTVRALSDLWQEQGLNTSYFQFADQDTTAWVDMSDVYRDHTANLSYGVTREIELAVIVPLGEAPGSKTTTIQALGVSIE